MASPIIEVLNNLVYEGFEYFGRYYSKYAGYVTDNEDPKSMGRVKVVVPGIIDNDADIWAWGTNQFAGKTQEGKSYGCQVLPIPGTVVWVEFEHGNPHKPMWSHGHFAEGEIDKELKSPLIHWFKTPAGHLVEMDDTEKAEEIRITDVHGNMIVLDKKGISLKVAKASNIFLGDLDKGDEPAVMGNTLEKIVAAHSGGILGAMKSVASTAKSFKGMMTKMAAATTPLGLVATLATEVPNLISDIDTDQKDLAKSNKSISDIAKTIPDIKSKTVQLKK